MSIGEDKIKVLARANSTPLYIYSKQDIVRRASELLAVSLPFGHTVRYAVKANPHPEIIRLIDESGLHFDASSSYEAERLLKQGISGDRISLSSQQLPHNFKVLFTHSVQFVATSQYQLKSYVKESGRPDTVALRINPGIGSGHNNRTSTGGQNSSFGIWHEYLDQALDIAGSHKIKVNRLHIHIGSGADPEAWGMVMDEALEITNRMPDVTVLDIGGGYKIARTSLEKEADMGKITKVFADKLNAFHSKTGRKIHLEIEPGTWLVGHGGVLVAEVTDIVDTGSQGYVFLRINTGMNDILRPTLYGAQHKISVIGQGLETGEFVVVGHNCETGDILTPALGDSESIQPRLLKKPSIGDLIVVHDAGAYCASMAVHGYNDFPSAKEILI